MAVLSSGHCATDFAGGALPALLPFWVDKFDLSYTLAAAVILASAISSSVVQPRFGLRPVLIVSSGVTGPLILVYLALGGIVGALALAGVGIAVIGTFGVTMV